MLTVKFSDRVIIGAEDVIFYFRKIYLTSAYSVMASCQNTFGYVVYLRRCTSDYQSFSSTTIHIMVEMQVISFTYKHVHNRQNKM